MAGQQKAIFLRFNMEDEADSSLYMKLAEAAGSVSLTSYACYSTHYPLEKSLFVAFISEFGAKKYCSTKNGCNYLNNNGKREQRSNRLSLWLPVFL